jgi:hypothetical protein
VIKEIDQHRDRQQHQHECRQQTDLRHEAGHGGRFGREERRFLRLPHRAQHRNRIDERADEGRQAELIAAIFHEIGKQARPVIAAGISDGGDRDREHGRRHADHRARNHGQHIDRPIGTRRLEPARLGDHIGPAIAVEPQSRGGRCERQQRKNGGQEPVARIDALPDRLETCHHASCPASIVSAARSSVAAASRPAMRIGLNPSNAASMSRRSRGY